MARALPGGDGGDGLLRPIRDPGASAAAFAHELDTLRESLLRMATLVEAQIADSLLALRNLDRSAADLVRRNDANVNEMFRELREQCFAVLGVQRPAGEDLRTLIGIQNISTELERIGDYAVRIARMTSTLAGLPSSPLRAEFGLIGELARRQVRDILDALIEQDEDQAREVAGRDDEIDRLYHRVFNDLIAVMAEGPMDSDEALRAVTLMLVAHNLERIGDRVTNVAEDIVFLRSGRVVELG